MHRDSGFNDFVGRPRGLRPSFRHAEEITLSRAGLLNPALNEEEWMPSLISEKKQNESSRLE
jgi:hypothetical protein